MANLSSQKFVAVGLSGGVDSGVAAFLLKNEGYYVEAVFMQNWHDSSKEHCTSEEDLKDVRLICDLLEIKLHVVDFSEEYWQKVFRFFLDEYAAGRTPNPDVLCNKEIKFRAFLDYARSLGADFIATGHYVRKKNFAGKDILLKGVDPDKDQSYFLYLLDREQLASSLFPLGELTKKEVRKIAKEIELPNYAKKDSTGICFIGERKFRDFLGAYLLNRPGDIVTSEGKKVGQHEGLMFYTMGQRKGIGVGGQKSAGEAPWYVVGKDQKNNQLIITQDREDPRLMLKELVCEQVHWISGVAPTMPFECKAKIRYRQDDQECVVSQDGKRLLVIFSESQWAITPGQSVVFYDQDRCLGGGIIV